MLQKLFNFISVLNRNSKVLQAWTKKLPSWLISVLWIVRVISLLHCLVNAGPFKPSILSQSLPCYLLQNMIFFFFRKKVTTQNAAGSLAKQNLTYTESWCDSQLFSLALAGEARIWIEMKQLWYCCGPGSMHMVGTTH